MKRKLRLSLFAIGLVLALFASPAVAQLATYSQDFEGMDPGSPSAMADDGWLVFGNVFSGVDGGYLYGYGVFGAPNGTPGFSSVAVGQGGPDQGAQQVVIYSDYNNGDHGNGNLIEANVFQEQIVGAADVGTFWRFQFDAKRGDINDPTGGTTAIAFIKTLDPFNGFALTNFIMLDTTNLPATWDTYELTIEIDASLEGQILQIGFASTATNYEPSGVFYDNVNLAAFEPLDCLIGPGNGDATIALGGCDSGVPNQTLESGCTMSDAIYECNQNASHHGQFVSCVAGLVNAWADDDLLEAGDKGSIISCAARNRRGMRTHEEGRSFGESSNPSYDRGDPIEATRSRRGR